MKSLLADAANRAAEYIASFPVAAALEKVCRSWLTDVLRLPPQTEVGFVTGATMANFAGLAAARHAVLASAGWDVEAKDSSAHLRLPSS
jgi:glutamate/tyrosine decarboxylase-like PLP-dependent enzyme